ncbi:uncharacterized protein LTR77_004253 [Saxophila tyrrhenica]|uniref:NTF2-like domain-containing protein n=1 Tax=Saxophila tyrrhenica TaxID=1690608 RepID=A0AAV9PC50_9PEZI|nr:hypothetical protein LTR77_004253 [Saxophila tyrrhenica]
MRSFIAAGLSLLTLASAQPFELEKRSATCMATKDAVKVAQNFRALIHEEFNTTLAQTAMTKDFTDYSDSVITLINGGCVDGPVALTTPTFSTRKEFIAGQSSQPPIPFKILNLWHTCSTVIIRWRASAPGTITTTQEPVTGIIVIETQPNRKKVNDQPFLIQTVFSEFNSGAWLYDLGVFDPTCPAPPPPSGKRSIAI